MAATQKNLASGGYRCGSFVAHPDKFLSAHAPVLVENWSVPVGTYVSDAFVVLKCSLRLILWTTHIIRNHFQQTKF